MGTVTKTVLAEVYETLRDVGVVQSESEFSRDWLGRSECYLRTVRFKQSQPSISSIAVCASRLEHYGRRMQRTEHYSALGERFVELAAECHRQINRTCEAEWLEA